MSSEVRYVKSNVTPESNKVLRILAAEKGKFIYEVIDEVLREKYPDYFARCEMKI